MSLMASALLCLSLNVFHEARGELIPGQYAVAQVTMRRADNDPAKVCSTVYRPKQFSWTLKSHKPPEVIDPDAWKKAQIVAKTVLLGRMPYDFSAGADHYHTIKVQPSWSQGAMPVARIQHHVFFRLQ